MFEDYVQPTQEDSDDYKPREHYGALVIARPVEFKPSVVTPNSPNGAPAVIVDICDVATRDVYRNVLMMTGAIVDGFKPYVGKLLVVTWDKRTSKAGRDYAMPTAATAEQVARATVVMQAGDPFAEKLSTIDAEPPF